jgi:hypothetical protein
MKTKLVELLRRESERFLSVLDDDPELGRIIRGEANRLQYEAFLIGSYQYVRWSGCLLARTALGLSRAGRSQELTRLATVKSREEGPHDQWLLRDLARLGMNTELMKGWRAPSAIESYVATSSAFADRGSPAFLGAAYTLEYISLHRAGMAAQNLRRRQQIPDIERCVSFLEGHGHADQQHIAELETLLSGLALAPTDEDDIALAAQLLRRLYPGFFRSLSGELDPCRI